MRNYAWEDHHEQVQMKNIYKPVGYYVLWKAW